MLLEMDPSECMYSEKGTKTDLLSDKKDLKTGPGQFIWGLQTVLGEINKNLLIYCLRGGSTRQEEEAEVVQNRWVHSVLFDEGLSRKEKKIHSLLIIIIIIRKCKCT